MRERRFRPLPQSEQLGWGQREGGFLEEELCGEPLDLGWHRGVPGLGGVRVEVRCGFWQQEWKA